MAIGFHDMKILIGIPAYNEEETIGDVIKSMPRKIKGVAKIDILVVDDGSMDRTSFIARRLGTVVLSHIINRGLGGSLKTIFAYASKNQYDLLVTFDADGQHRAADITRLVEPIIDGKKDVMIGTRWGNKNRKPLVRYLVNECANLLTWLLFGVYTTDSQSGLRAFNRKAIEKIQITSDGMEVSSEFFKEIQANKLRFGEVEIEPLYTDYSIKKGQRIDNAPEVIFKLILKFLR